MIKYDIDKPFKTEDFIRNLIKDELIDEANRNLTKIGMNMDTPIYPKSKSVRTINILDNELELTIAKFGKLVELVQELRKELYDKDEIIRALERESYD